MGEMKYVLPLLIFSFASYASYNTSCLEQLTINKETSPALNDFYNQWIQTIRRIGGISRQISDLEYEACLDLNKGLSLRAKFGNGKQSEFKCEASSLEKLSRWMKRTNVVEVQFSEEALRRMGKVLKDACLALGHSGCEAYDNYIGFIDPQPRPFNPRAERAIKWATFHMFPTVQVAIRLRRLEHEERMMVLMEYHERVLIAAQETLASEFRPVEAVLLFEKVVKPLLDAGFERVRYLSDSGSLH